MEIRAMDVESAYNDAWWRIHTDGVKENSRNGPVITIPEPVLLTIHNPLKRVLFNEARDANPFFHVAETVWMLAGCNDVQFIKQFNKRYEDYADEGRVYGAYGFRWREHWVVDQILKAARLLKRNHEDRRVVIGMWDPGSDLGADKRDVPCNTQIMFRVYRGALDMLVTNRSNDMVWGMLGANVVHFTYLQEAVAFAVGVKVGCYRVVTNNLHVYTNMPRYEEIRTGGLHGVRHLYPGTYPILQSGESLDDLLTDCEEYVHGSHSATSWRTQWMKNVALPMMYAYLSGPSSAQRSELISKIAAPDWKKACEMWVARRAKS